MPYTAQVFAKGEHILCYMILKMKNKKEIFFQEQLDSIHKDPTTLYSNRNFFANNFQYPKELVIDTNYNQGRLISAKLI